VLSEIFISLRAKISAYSKAFSSEAVDPTFNTSPPERKIRGLA